MSKRKTIRKVIVGILLGIVALLLLVIIVLQTQWAKNFIRSKAEAFLQKKLQTGVRIGKLDYSLPTWIEIQDIAVEDRTKDTLLRAGRLRVDIDMLSLLFNDINIRNITLEHTVGNLHRAPNDSTFNFQFIIDAFDSGGPTTPVVKDTTALKIALRKLNLLDVRLNYRDSFSSMQFNAWINHLQTSINKFQPDKLVFAINDFTVDTVNFSMVSWAQPVSKPVQAAVVTDTAAMALLVSANTFLLKHIIVSYADSAAKMYYGNNITALGVEDLNFDLAGMKATADKISLNNSGITFGSSAPATVAAKDTVTATPSWKVQVKKLELANNEFRMDNNAMAPLAEGVDVNHLYLSKLGADVEDLYYAGMDSITADVRQLTVRDRSGLQVDTTRVNLLLSKNKLAVTGLYLKTPGSMLRDKINLSFDSLSGITRNPATTKVNAQLPNTRLAVSDLLLFAPQLKERFTPAQRNSYVLVNTNMSGTLARLDIPVLQVQLFGGSRITGRATVYNITDPGKLGYDFYANPILVNMQDIAGFLPDSLKAHMATLPKQVLVTGSFKGNMQNLQTDATIKADSQLLSIKGSITNLADPKKLKYDVLLRNSYVTRSFIYSFVPQDSLPLALPDWVSMKGTLRGDMYNVHPDVVITSAYGTTRVKGAVTNLDKPAIAAYGLTAGFDDFRLGTLLKQDSLLGNITGELMVTGKGLDTATINAHVKANIASVGLMGYNYQRVDLDAAVDRKSAEYNLSIGDPNLQVTASGNVNLNNAYPTIQSVIHLDTARLMALGFTTDTLDLSSHANINFTSLDPKRPDGQLLITRILLTQNHTKYYLDTVQATAGYSDSGINIALRSPIMEAQATGKFDYTKLGAAMQGLINNYYHSSATDTLLVVDTTGKSDPQQLNLAVKVFNHPVWKSLMPGLVRFETITANAALDTERDSALSLNLNIPFVNYNGTILSKSVLAASGDRKQLKYDFQAKQIITSDIIVYAPSLTGNMQNNTADLTVSLKDRKMEERHRIHAVAFLSDTAYTLKLPDILILDYKPWTVHTPNYLRYANNTITAQNFRISSKKQLVALQTDFTKQNLPLQLSIDSFQLSTITSFFNKDTAFLEGQLNTDIEVADFSKQLPSFSGKASVTNITYNKKPVGKLMAEFKKADENTVAMTMNLSEQGNDVAVDGKYYLNNASKQLDVDMQLRHLNPAVIEPFTPGMLKNISGGITGKMAVTGMVSKPEWNGNLKMDTMLFTVVAVNTRYRIYNQNIDFKYPVVTFNNFAVTDSQGHKLVIDGTVKSNTLSSYALGLNINADNFTVVNAKKAADNTAYGYAEISTKLSVKGTTDRPSIEGNVNLGEKTNVTYVMPQLNSSLEDARRIVRFVDMDTVNQTQLADVFESEPGDTLASTIDYNVNLRIPKEAAVTVVVDPASGDELKVQGTANLNAGVDAAGNMALTGVYELQGGYYSLNKIVKKKFTLQAGSTITFAGDPTQGVADITAVYVVNTSPNNLVGTELAAGTTTGVSSGYNERIPFQVLLKLKGPLLKPDISFDIETDKNTAGVNSQLSTAIDSKLTQMRSDPTQMNKQVFSLLVLNRFVAEQSNDFFGGGGGINAGTAAQQSVTQFLSEALNQVADELIRGVDINMNVESYETTNSSNRTDLSVALSKGFLNDRLTVSVGKNFVLEGSDPSAQQSNNSSMQFLPDITTTYKLTSDGKYLLRAYRKNQYEAILDGYFIETGVAFSVTMDYNRFKQIFQRNRRRRERMRDVNSVPATDAKADTNNKNQ